MINIDDAKILLSELDQIKSFNEKKKFLDSKFKKIGAGSSRIVYLLNEQYVIKFAKNTKGIGQNGIEASISRYVDDIIAKVIDSAEDDTWLISEYAKKITESIFEKVLGFNFKTFCYFLYYTYDIHNGIKNSPYEKFVKNTESNVKDFIENSEFYSNILDIMLSYDVSVGDLCRISSYGIYKNKIVVVDYGADSNLLKTYYHKRLRERNEDSDELKFINERIMNYINGSKFVSPKEKCLIGSKKICNRGDINNWNINETINPVEANDDISSLKTVVDNLRDIGTLSTMNNNFKKIIDSYNLGVIPVDNKFGRITYIIYRDKYKANRLRDIMMKYNGLMANENIDDIREIGYLLGYDKNSVEKYISNLKKKKNLSEKTINEDTMVNINKLPFKDDIYKLGGKIYSVGGAVRDEFLGKTSKDLDILITGIPLNTLEDILNKYGSVNSVGQSFGIIKFKINGVGEEIDIAIPRKERPTTAQNGGHKDFEITSDHNLPIEDDLYRRDITINSIAKDAEGNFIDPYNGIYDIKNKIIRVVNHDAFSDDPLRMLRCVQFASRFDFDIEPKTLQLIQNNAERIKNISKERILIEFNKIVTKGDKLLGANLLYETNLFKNIFNSNPKVDFNQLADKFSLVKTIGEFIYLLTLNFENQDNIFKNDLKGDVDNYKLIKSLMLNPLADQYESNIPSLRLIASKMFIISPNILDSNIVNDKLLPIFDEFNNGKYPKTVNDLSINGNDLMNLGYSGKEIGDIQRNILLNIYSDKIKNNKKSILLYLDGNKK